MSCKNKAYNCGKVKNACKYCLEQVTNKSGLQCQGACKKWAHFKCLNYTPGKISDIKAGIIKVTCPCPDCETTQLKEYLVNPPYSCSNHKCPANNTGPIRCDSTECPSNTKSESMQCSNKACSDNAVIGESHRITPACRQTLSPRSGSPQQKTCMSPSDRPKRIKMKRRPAKSSSNSSDSCGNVKCPRNKNVDGDSNTQASMVEAVQQMCGTVGMLSVQLKDLMSKLNKMA